MAGLLVGAILGVVQGVSEWLPVSSKTQIIIVTSFLSPNLSFSAKYALGLFLEAGTFVAALAYFRKEVVGVLKALVGRGDEESRLLLKFLVIVTVFTALIGLAIYKEVSSSLTGPALGVPMIVLGSVLIGDGCLIALARRRPQPTRGLKDLKFWELVAIGVVQGLAAFPGVSRSGTTVSAMLLLGVKPSEAFKMSFLALIPASVGAAGATVLITKASVSSAVSSIGAVAVLVALAVTVLVGLASIRELLKFAATDRVLVLTFVLGALAILSGAASIIFGSALG